jgi:hypothetical protein
MSTAPSSVESTEIGTMTADGEGEGQKLTSECALSLLFNLGAARQGRSMLF